MHFPSPLDYRDIARPEPVERLVIRATANMRRLLLSGATTARDTGGALAVRAALRDGIAPGPRLLVTGAPITTTAGHYWFLGGEADTTDEVVRRVRERKLLGVDAVKVILSGGGYTPTSNPRSQQYGPETLRAAVVEAHRLGLPVLAHSLTTVSNRNAVAAGVDTVIHGGVWWTEFDVRDRAYDYDPLVADAMAAQGTWVDPTIGEVQLHDEHHAAARPAGPSSSTGRCRTSRASSRRDSTSCATWPRAGSRFIGGMGMGMPIVSFDTVACSAQVYARLLGFDPWRAIRAITSEAAAALGLHGTVGAIGTGSSRISWPCPGIRSPASPPCARRATSSRPGSRCPGRSLAGVAPAPRTRRRSPAPRRPGGSRRRAGGSRRPTHGPDHDHRVAGLERPDDLGGGSPIGGGFDADRRSRHRAVGRRHWLGPGLQTGDLGQGGGQLAGKPEPAGDLRRLVTFEVSLERHQQPDDLLLARLHRAPDPVARDPRQGAALQQAAAGPRRGQHVEVLVLERDRPDEVRPAGKEPRCLRAADGLATAERDKVGAGGDEPAEIVRGEVHRTVDQHRQAVSVRDRDRVGQRQPGWLLVGLEEHPGDPAVDRALQLGGARAGRPAHLDEPCAGRAHEMVVAVRWTRWTSIPSGRPSVCGSRSIRSGSSPARMAAVPSVSPAAAPHVT